MKLNAAYVAVGVMHRSLEFCRRVFDREPVKVDDRSSTFDLGGTILGLFDPAVDAESVTFGDNCVPNIEVDDIHGEFERVHEFAPRIDASIRQAGTYSYFQFDDPDGIRIEFYSAEK